MTALNPEDRLLRSCRGEEVDRPPVWLMRQAGRYLPEYREVRKEVSFLELCRDVERAVEVLCIIWTRCELELPRTIHCDGHLDVDRERLRQLDSATRDKDAMLRNQVQPGVGLNLRI